MTLRFEELDYQETPIGPVSLRRRYEPLVDQQIYEVKLGDDFLMSSLFTASEIALADLAIGKLGSDPLDVVVGGLGLGYTAGAVLEHRSVQSLLVVDFLPAVIGWHQNNLLPLSNQLTSEYNTDTGERETSGLVGQIPESIGQLRFLQSLLLSKNLLSGSIPDSVSTLVYLNTIDLEDNNVGSRIPPSLNILEQLDRVLLARNR